jgi:hypothetical protein
MNGWDGDGVGSALLAFVAICLYMQESSYIHHSSYFIVHNNLRVVTSAKEGNNSAVDDDLLRDAGLLDEEVTTATAASNGEKQDENGAGNGAGNGEERPVVATDGSVLDMGKSYCLQDINIWAYATTIDCVPYGWTISPRSRVVIFCIIALANNNVSLVNNRIGAWSGGPPSQ